MRGWFPLTSSRGAGHIAAARRGWDGGGWHGCEFTKGMAFPVSSSLRRLWRGPRDFENLSFPLRWEGQTLSTHSWRNCVGPTRSEGTSPVRSDFRAPLNHGLQLEKSLLRALRMGRPSRAGVPLGIRLGPHLRSRQSARSRTEACEIHGGRRSAGGARVGEANS